MTNAAMQYCSLQALATSDHPLFFIRVTTDLLCHHALFRPCIPTVEQ